MPSHAFPGFSDEAINFLNDLHANNEREWFKANKKTYDEEIKAPAEIFVEILLPELKKLTGLDYRSKIFRIHRDVRFSKDKTPYNTHLHIGFIAEGEALKLSPMWFFGLQRDNFALGAGTFDFGKDTLEIYRQKIVREGVGLTKLIEGLKGQNIRISNPQLKRVPKGYEAEAPHDEWLKHKSLHAWVDYEDTSPAASDDLVETCLIAYQKLLPLNQWLMEL